MNALRTSMLLLVSVAAGSVQAATTANQFLRYVFGGDGIEIEKLCWPNDDLWMLRGTKNAAGLAELETEKIAHRDNEVVMAMIQNASCYVDVREGRVDAAFMLEQVYTRHRQVVLQFLYAALLQDPDALKALATKPANVKFGRAKRPPPGDMDVYQGVIAGLPVVRSSLPSADKAAQSVTYRVPLGAKGFSLRLVRRNGTWLVDTDARVDVPLESFFQ